MCPDLISHSSQKVARSSGIQNNASRRGSWQTSQNLPTSFRYAKQGLVYGFLSQRNFRIHLFLGAITFGLGLWLNLGAIHIAILALTVGSVLVLELINTSIEAVVDLSIGRRFHPLAAIAKDCAAAAVLVASIISVLIASLLLLPALVLRLGL